METGKDHSSELPTIVVEQRVYFYHTRPFQVINTLGFVRAVLTEYIVVGAGGEIYQLYKTNEGNWYDDDTVNKKVDKQLLRLLKVEIDIHQTGEL